MDRDIAEAREDLQDLISGGEMIARLFILANGNSTTAEKQRQSEAARDVALFLRGVVGLGALAVSAHRALTDG